MEISKKLRDAAATHCGIMASWWMGDDDVDHPFGHQDQDDRDKYLSLYALVSHARIVVGLCNSSSWKIRKYKEAIAWAEAEALLRAGWQP